MVEIGVRRLRTKLPAHNADQDQFVRGFLILMPLWAGAIPSGIAYGVAARNAGLSVLETQLMSAVVFSAAAQLSAISQLTTETPHLVIITTAVALNVQLLLIGAVIKRQLALSWLRRIITAWFLTDGSYGVTAASGQVVWPRLLGAGVSMYLAWNLGTALGVAAGALIPNPAKLGVDLVVPLTFQAVLVPLLRTKTAASVALVAGCTALVMNQIAAAGVAVLMAGIVGSVTGALLECSKVEPCVQTGGELNG